MRSPCLVCGSDDTIPYVFPPYETCKICDHTYQPDLPPKVWMNPGDGNSNGYSGAVMNDFEKSVNDNLAGWIHDRYEPKRTLDIGSGYPYLSSRFTVRGSEAHAVDGGFKEDLISVDGINNVKTAAVDWESDELPWSGKFDLITMIHVFEHMYHPEEAAKKAFDLLNPEGVFFVRVPNKDVLGIDRDHTEGHAKIHPSIYGTSSIINVMAKVGFHLIWMEHQSGFGQSSFVFKKRPPKIGLTMIVKNEEENIGPCLDSVRSFCDEMIVLDTGSTDRTVLKAIEHGAIVHHSEYFNENTSIGEFHFANARNESLSLLANDIDWVFWMDADDIFEGNIILNPELDGYNVTVVYGNDLLKHARFFRRGWSNGFMGAIHEVPEVSQCRMGKMSTCKIHHKAAPKEGRCERNTSILENEYKQDPNNLRTLFYLANSYMDIGKNAEAISKYKKYIDSGGNFHDELVIAYIYISNCYYNLGKYAESIRWALRGITVDDRWSELYCRIGESYMNLGKHNFAIHYFNIALMLEPIDTVMWTQNAFYDSIPKWQLSRCYEWLGELDKAKQFANDNRLKEINSGKAKTVKKVKQTIELVRPGALGDIIATTPSVSWYRKNHPDAWIRYICHSSAYQILQHNPDIDEIAFEEGECDIRKHFHYPMNLGYPDKPMTKHLVEHFADSVGASLPEDWRCTLVLSDDSILGSWDLPKKYIAFAVKTGWSKYKDWPIDYWEHLIGMFKKEHPEYKWVKIGGPDEPEIKSADFDFSGITDLETAFAILQNSKLFVGLDSVFNHACNALRVPAVIMFGSTHPTGSGYREQTNLAANLDCQPCYRENNDISVHPKPPCPHSHACMVDHLPPYVVYDAIKAKLKNISDVHKLPMAG